MGNTVTVTSLVIYPIKSAAGLTVESAEVTCRGLAWDRRWMVVDGDGRFLTQRRHPRLALVSARLSDSQLEVRAPGMQRLDVPTAPSGTERRVRVWSDDCTALSVGDEAATWFTRFLDVDCDLVFMPESTRRPVSASYARDGDIVSFADGFPLLLANEQSLAVLNSMLERPVSMRRFRPNLVVGGADAFEEDRWSVIRAGEVSFRVSKPCGRCMVVNVDPDTGESSAEPLRTLSTFRREGDSVNFGQNIIPDIGPGIGPIGTRTIRVGDVVSTKPSPIE